MLPQAEVGPLVDCIDHRRAEAPDFSMKGRGVLAMMRAMREWHGQLSKEKAAAGRVFPSSGLEPMDIDWSRRDGRGNRVVEVWHFREILDARTLADEGPGHGPLCLLVRPMDRERPVLDLDGDGRGQRGPLAEADDRGPSVAAPDRPGARSAQSLSRAEGHVGARGVGDAQQAAGIPWALVIR
jgi:hypothetical protein